VDPPTFGSITKMINFYNEMKELGNVTIDKTHQAIELLTEEKQQDESQGSEPEGINIQIETEQ